MWDLYRIVYCYYDDAFYNINTLLYQKIILFLYYNKIDLLYFISINHKI